MRNMRWFETVQQYYREKKLGNEALILLMCSTYPEIALLEKYNVKRGIYKKYDFVKKDVLKAVRDAEESRNLKPLLDNYIKVGEKYSDAELKEIISEVYGLKQINLRVRAVDVRKYYKIQRWRWRIKGKMYSGYKIIEDL